MKEKFRFLAYFASLSRIFLLLVFLTPFKGLLPPLLKVQCANLLDFLNPWGKVMEKVVSDLKTFAHKGCKFAAAQKKFFTIFLLHLFTPFRRLFAPKVQCPNFLDFWNPLGKVFERNGLR